jgi:hypothetical protein
MTRQPSINAVRYALSVGLAVLRAAPASAQSPDDLFDPDTLQELRLTINSRDLRRLRTNYGNDTYHRRPAVAQHPRANAGCARGGASRGGIKLGLSRLQPLCWRSEFLTEVHRSKNLWTDR